MQKWEYKDGEIGSGHQIFNLNELGQEGWEAVGFYVDNPTRVLLKRLIPEQDEQIDDCRAKAEEALIQVNEQRDKLSGTGRGMGDIQRMAAYDGGIIVLEEILGLVDTIG